SEVDGLLTGREIRFFQEWLRHSEPGDPYWELRGNPDVARVPAPVCMVGGWYDIFLPWQLRDYATLRAAGARPRLVIGTWTHADLALLGVSMREGIAWFRAALNGGARGGVRVHIGGRDEWRDLPDWPPHSGSTAWFLGVFVRVCDVAPDGRSENLTDGLVRVLPGMFPPGEDGVRAVEVELWPIGYVFRRGHRIRVQLAGAAHPRYARNTGTGEPLGTAARLQPVDYAVFRDPAHPSALRLPVGGA